MRSALMTGISKICSSIMRRRPHQVATKEWSNIRYECIKTPLDHLLDILEVYPDTLMEYTTCINTKLETEAFRSAMKAKVFSLLRKFDQWATYFVRLSEGEQACMFPEEWELDATSPMSVPILGTSQPICAPPQIVSNNQSIALLLCLFSAGCAISFGILSSLEPDNSSLSDKTQQHCELILSATEALDSDSRASISSVYLLATFPLTVVATWSPCPQQRDRAYRKTGFTVRS